MTTMKDKSFTLLTTEDCNLNTKDEKKEYQRIGLGDMNINDYISNGSFFIFVG